MARKSKEQELVGKWVRRTSDGATFKVKYLGQPEKSNQNRRALYGSLRVAYVNQVEVVDEPIGIGEGDDAGFITYDA